jgi:hypothetical protein
MSRAVRVIRKSKTGTETLPEIGPLLMIAGEESLPIGGI